MIKTVAWEGNGLSPGIIYYSEEYTKKDITKYGL